MRSLLYAIAIVLILCWLAGILIYSVGSLIHILLVFAVISLILGLMRRRPRRYID